MAHNLDDVDPEEPTGLYADPRAPEAAPRAGRLRRVIAALAVMGVFAGGLWFAYTQGLRHAGGSGDQREIPLVRADTTPFKIKPENPGGMQMPDRDMLIYGEQHPPIEHLLPPPEQPMARPAPPPPPAPPQQAVSQPPPTAAPPSEQTTANSPPPPSPSGLQAPEPQAPGQASTQARLPPNAAPKTSSIRPAAPAPPATDLIGQKIEQLEEAAAASRPKRSEGGQSEGLRLQLGALRNESEARGAWERLKRSNTDLLGNLTGGAVRADLGEKGIYYRIETGPIGDPATASRLCSELRQRHLACMIIR